MKTPCCSGYATLSRAARFALTKLLAVAGQGIAPTQAKPYKELVRAGYAVEKDGVFKISSNRAGIRAAMGLRSRKSTKKLAKKASRRR